MTDTTAAAQFHQAMLATYQESVKVGYRPTRFLQMVNERGGVETARIILGQESTSDGFTTLWEKGRLDLTVEAQVLKPEFADLFTEEDRAKARARLAEVSYTPPWDPPREDAVPPPPAPVPSLVERLAHAVSNTQGGSSVDLNPTPAESTGVEAGLSGQEQIRLALRAMADNGGSATMQLIYAAVEAQMGGTRLSDAGRASLRYFINNVSVKGGFVHPYDPASPGWRITPAGLQLLNLSPEDQQASLEELEDDGLDEAPPIDNQLATGLAEWRSGLSSQHAIVRRALDDYPSWLMQTFGDRCDLRFYSTRPEIGAFIDGRWHHFVSFNRTRALYALIAGLTEEDLGLLRAGLSAPDTLKEREYGSKVGHRFFIETEGDYALLKQMVSRSMAREAADQTPPPEPLDGPAFVLIHGGDGDGQYLGRSYSFSLKAGGAPRQLLNAVTAWRDGGPPVYLVIYRPGPHYSFAGWARVTAVREEPYPGTDEMLHILEYAWHPFPIPVRAHAMQTELAWLGKGLNIAFRGKSIKPVSSADVRTIARRAYPSEITPMSAADAAYLVLSRAGGGPLQLSELLARIQAEGLAEFRGQTPQLSLSSTLLRDERFHNLGKNTWVLASVEDTDNLESEDAVIAEVIPEPATRTPAIYADDEAEFWRIHFPRSLWPTARRYGVIGIGWPLDSNALGVRKFHRIAAGDRVIAYVQGGLVGGVGVVTRPFDPHDPRAGVPAEVDGEEFTQCIRVAWVDALVDSVDLTEAFKHPSYRALYNRVKNPNTVVSLPQDDYVALLSLLQIDDAGVPTTETRLPDVWELLTPYLTLVRTMGERSLEAEQIQELARTIDPPPSASLDEDDLVAELLQLRLVEAVDATSYWPCPYVAGDEQALLRLCALALLVPLEGSADQYTLPARAILPRLQSTADAQPVKRFAPELSEADSTKLAGWYAEAGLVEVEDDSWRPAAGALDALPGTDIASSSYNLFLQTLLAELAGTLKTDLTRIEADAALPPVDDFDARLRELGQDLLFDSAVVRRIYRSLLAGRNVVLSGPPGTGKTELARRLPSLLWREDSVTFNRLSLSPTRPPVEQVTEQRDGYAPVVVTATEDWGVRDVVGGIGPRLDGQSGALSYTIDHGALTRVLLQHYDETGDGRRLPPIAAGFTRRDYRPATRERYRGAWLVIDEFTRAPIDAAFGSLLTTLSGGQRAALAVPTREGELREVPLPRDFRIIGTLNSFDRHFLNQISEAMKRRFDFIDVLPPPPAYADYEQGIAVREALRRMREDGFTTIERSDDGQTFHWPGLLRVELAEDGDGLRRYRAFADSPEAAAALDSFWRLFSAIRVFRQLGTAQMIAVYLNLLTGVRVGMTWPDALDTALADGLADQLQVLSRDEQHTIEAMIEHAGNPVNFATAVKKIVRELPPGRRSGYLYALREREATIHGDSTIDEATLGDAQISRVFSVDSALAIPRMGVFRRRLRDLIGERGL